MTTPETPDTPMPDLQHRVSNQKLFDLPAGFLMAFGVHALLFFSLSTVFQWKTEPQTFYAEIWAPENASGTNLKGEAAQSEVETKPEPVSDVTPEDIEAQEKEIAAQKEAAAAQEAALEAQRLEQEAQIRLEEEQLRLEQEAKRRLEEEQRKKAQEEQKKRLEIERRQRIEKERKEKEAARRAQEKRVAEEIHRAELARITGAKPVTSGQVGKTTGTPGITRNSPNGALSSAYAASVRACIHPKINYAVPSNIKAGTHVAIYSVNLLPDGSQVGTPTLLKSSGLAAYDSAVNRAIRFCNPFPKPKDGSALPRSFQLEFDPIDNARR